MCIICIRTAVRLMRWRACTVFQTLSPCPYVGALVCRSPHGRKCTTQVRALMAHCHGTEMRVFFGCAELRLKVLRAQCLALARPLVLPLGRGGALYRLCRSASSKSSSKQQSSSSHVQR